MGGFLPLSLSARAALTRGVAIGGIALSACAGGVGERVKLIGAGIVAVVLGPAHSIIGDGHDQPVDLVIAI